MLHDGYAERFEEAEERTRAWGVDHGLAFDVLRGLGTDFAMATLPTIGRIIDSPAFAHFTFLDIRLHCAEIHRSVFANQHSYRAPCVLTIGDVEVDGKLEYGTTHEQLAEEMGGQHRHSNSSYPCHVWLTFPDMHIVDVTFFVYRYYDQVDPGSRWSDYVICSDPRHARGATLPLRYVPMLVGEPCVRAMVDVDMNLFGPR